jgi:hypothetical protein
MIVAREDGVARVTRVLLRGVSIVPSEEMDPDIAAAIGQISQGPNGEVRVRLHDKHAALHPQDGDLHNEVVAERGRHRLIADAVLCMLAPDHVTCRGAYPRQAGAPGLRKSYNLKAAVKKVDTCSHAPSLPALSSRRLC